MHLVPGFPLSCSFSDCGKQAGRASSLFSVGKLPVPFSVLSCLMNKEPRSLLMFTALREESCCKTSSAFLRVEGFEKELLPG